MTSPFLSHYTVYETMHIFFYFFFIFLFCYLFSNKQQSLHLLNLLSCSPSFLRTSGVGRLRTFSLVMVLLTTQVQFPTSEDSTLATYRLPVSWDINRRVSCWTKQGYSLKIHAKVSSRIKRNTNTINALGGRWGQWVNLNTLQWTLINIIRRNTHWQTIYDIFSHSTFFQYTML